MAMGDAGLDLVWRQRETLVFPGVLPGQWMNLPFFMISSEKNRGPMVFTDERGVILQHCCDRLYEADDHDLIWIKFGDFHWGEESGQRTWLSPDYQATVLVYSNVEKCDGTPLPLASYCSPVGPSRPEDVLPLAEYFAGDEVASEDDVVYDMENPRIIPGWHRKTRDNDEPEILARYLAVQPLDDSAAMSHLPAQLHEEPRGQALMMDPGRGREVLTCPATMRFHGTSGRVHVRGHFYDHIRSGALASISEKSAHWLGIHTPLGSAAIGVTSECAGSYAFITGCCPDGSIEQGLQWETTSVTRSCGWHLFELVLQSTRMQVLVDGEPVAEVEAAGAASLDTLESFVHLVAKKGDPGYWAGIELLHTPLGDGWEGCVQSVTVGDRSPWHRQSVEPGSWHVRWNGHCSAYVMDGSVEVTGEPASAAGVPAVAPEVPAPFGGALAIECWSLPGENDVERVERAMSTFIEHLVEQGVVVPDNVFRIAQCGSKQHPSCYVYRFGTRRLHVGVQEGVSGRLALVVRCGGGFMDFAEFARRNGRIEQIRMNQTKPSEGRTVVHVTSVLSKGQKQVKAAPAASGIVRRPVSTPGRAVRP